MKRNKLRIYIPLIIVSTLIVAGGVYWYLDFARYIKTDDALVASDAVTVSPKIMGRISKLYVEEGDSVQQGQLLAELDSADLMAQKRQIAGGKLQAQANKDLAIAKYQFDEKNAEVLKVGIQRAKDDFERGKAQYTGGVIPKEQFDHLQKAYETAQVQYEAAMAQIRVSKTQIKSSETAIVTSQSQIDAIDTQLKNTRLYAPSNGIVAKRWLLVGDIANVGQSIFTINNTSKFWVVLYLEETNMSKLNIGQAAIFTLDTYLGSRSKVKFSCWDLRLLHNSPSYLPAMPLATLQKSRNVCQ